MTDWPLVTLVRREFGGTVYRQSLPAPAAVALLLTDPQNGDRWKSGHVEWDEVAASDWPLGYDLPITPEQGWDSYA